MSIASVFMQFAQYCTTGKTNTSLDWGIMQWKC